MNSVFLVQHLHTLPDGNENVKTIGVYSSRTEALAAIDRLRRRPGFSASPRLVDPVSDDFADGFYVDEYELDRDNWPEGFVTV